jgi:glycosyltransferase involved in cell wall biosynthesis
LRPQRILYVDLAPAVGGSVISLYHLVKGLDRRRFEPSVVMAASNGYVARFQELGVPLWQLGEAALAEEQAGSEPWSAVRHSRLTRLLKRLPRGEDLVHAIGFWLRVYPGLRARARELAKIMREVKPELVHLNDAVCVSQAGIMAARRVRAPAICHLRSMDQRSFFERWLSRSLRGYICVSRAVDEHQRTLGGRTSPSWVVYNGIDLAEFATLPQTDSQSRAAWRSEWGWTTEDIVIGSIGRIVPWKGQHVFLSALAQLLPRYPNLRGLIVGAAEPRDQEYAAALRQQAHRLGLEHVVRYTGYRADISRLLHGMDILAHTSISPEPFGRVIIEGMATGVTVIATRAGGAAEIIEDSASGLLVPMEDVEALAQAVARVVDNPDQAAAWRSAARQRVEQMFTVQRYVQGVEQVYEEILR